MPFVKYLKCVLCGSEYDPSEILYVCPKHGNEGIVDVIYDYGAIRQRLTKKQLAQDPTPTIWRYFDLLPIKDRRFIPPLRVGLTPLYKAERLGSQIGLEDVWIKDDGRQPTASFKDRASAVGVAKALELGRDVMTAASTGNAAASLAGLAASVGIKTHIFVPKTAPEAKIAQLLIFGADVIAVNGTYDQAFDLCLQASAEYGWYSRNTGYNPYLSEGKKTASLEICEQLGWRSPDRIFVSVGDGCIMGGIGKGLRDLMELGFIERMPKLMGVQAEGSAVLVKAWQDGTETIEPIVPQTIADSISVGIPRDRIKALRAVRETDGEFITVSDDEILEAMRVLARYGGVFGEPAGVAGFAGLQKMVRQKRIDPTEKIVVLVTGNGLKDVSSAIKAAGRPHLIEPTFEDLKRFIEQRP